MFRGVFSMFAADNDSAVKEDMIQVANYLKWLASRMPDEKLVSNGKKTFRRRLSEGDKVLEANYRIVSHAEPLHDEIDDPAVIEADQALDALQATTNPDDIPIYWEYYRESIRSYAEAQAEICHELGL